MSIKKKWNLLITPKEASQCSQNLSNPFLDSFSIQLTNGRIQKNDHLIEILKDKDAAILDLESITPQVLDACPRLKILSRFGEGCDAIDLLATKKYGVKVTKTHGVAAQAVARHTLSFILAFGQRIVENDRNIKNGVWIRQDNISPQNCTLGILGFGKIGQNVAKFAQILGFKILVYSHHQTTKDFPFAASLDELLTLSDIVSLHLPLNSETQKIISMKQLKKLKNKFLINTARGGLIDESALLETLDQKLLSGYATDVFSSEPVSALSEKIAKHPKTICSPHIAALDKATAMEMTQRAINNAYYALTHQHLKVSTYID